MGWDASRPVPYKRLLKEWLIFAPIMAGVLWVMQRDSGAFAGSLFGIAVSLPLYLGLGSVLAKFGYQRKSLTELRTPRATADRSTTTTTVARQRPAPTKRTSPGRNRPNRKRR
jgi:hypothetical protein